MKLADAPDVLTVEQAASVLAVARGTAYEAVRAGQIPSVRIGRCIRVPRQALERLLCVDCDDAGLRLPADYVSGASVSTDPRTSSATDADRGSASSKNRPGGAASDKRSSEDGGRHRTAPPVTPPDYGAGDAFMTTSAAAEQRANHRDALRRLRGAQGQRKEFRS